MMMKKLGIVAILLIQFALVNVAVGVVAGLARCR